MTDDNICKVYKEKPYLNSSGYPFGLTLNGKTKEYVDAHENVKGLVIKGKVIDTAAGKIKFLDAFHNKTMINAIVEVVCSDAVKGNVELKVYNPSNNKKKVATMELRKVSDFEYNFVEKLRDIITCLLDNFIKGDDSEVFEKNKVNGGITSKPKLFTCDVCDWQTRFAAALKGHKKIIHSNPSGSKPFFYFFILFIKSVSWLCRYGGCLQGGAAHPHGNHGY